MADKDEPSKDFVQFDETLVEPFSVEDLAIPTHGLTWLDLPRSYSSNVVTWLMINKYNAVISIF